MRFGGIGVTLLAWLLFTQAAGATTARVDFLGEGRDVSSVLVVEAADGETNRITLDFDRGTRDWIVRDAGAPLTGGQGCAAAGDGLRCSMTSQGAPHPNSLSYASAIVRAGDGNDRIDAVVPSRRLTFEGGPGDDHIVTTDDPGATYMNGQKPDRDRYVVLNRWDWHGFVKADGGPGADVLENSSPGVYVSYVDRQRGVNISLDGIANDGEPGEGDNILGTYFAIEGTEFDDTVKAGEDDVGVEALGGNDVIEGSDGPDIINPGDGDDTVRAGSGDDLVARAHNSGGDYSGGPGADRLRNTASPRGGLGSLDVILDGLPNDGDSRPLNVRPDFEDIVAGWGDLVGSPANETLTGANVDGGAGDDYVKAMGTAIGGAGRDIISGRRAAFARDGETDSVECGAEWPLILELDPIDIAPGCTPIPKLAAATPTRRPDSKGYFSVRVSCTQPAAIPCQGAVRLRSAFVFSYQTPAPPTIYASGTIRPIAGGRTGVAKLRVKAAYRKQLKNHKRVKGALVSETPVADGSGSRLTTLGTLKLLTPRR